MTKDHEKQILDGSAHARKTFEFLEQDPTQPAQWWFQESPEGLVLFVVLYSQACRWNRCVGCNLPSMSSLHEISYRELVAQIDNLFAKEEIKERLGDVHKLILSNNGSILDEATFPTTALMHFLVRLNLLAPALEVLSIETRPEYVEWDELALLSRALGDQPSPVILELAIGFEAFDDHVRNNLFKKGLTLERFEQLVELMTPYDYHLKCYFMQKPVPGMSDEEAIADIKQAIDFLDRCARRHDVHINMHLNPTYVARGTPLEEAYEKGEYAPPRLRDVARAALHAKDKQLSVFLGLYDEGLTVPGGSFVREGEQPLLERLEEFNREQDYALLEGI